MMKLILLSALLGVSVAQYDYSDALMKSMLFYEANRSGPLPDDNRIDYRYDSTEDDFIVGGYFDAGDHVKFGFPMAAMTTQLAWGGATFAEGYESAAQMDYFVDCLKWSTDYFIAAHTDTNTFYGQVGDGYLDHDYWGRPEEMTMARPAFFIDSSNPGSDLAGETAAALAAASIFYDQIGMTEDAEATLQHARELFDLADNYRGTYTSSIPAGDFYNSWSGYYDELAWAAAWLAKATGEDSYLSQAESLFDANLDYQPTEFSWDNKVAGVQVLLFELTGDSKYETAMDEFLDFVMFSATKTPKGLVYLNDYGSLRHAANVAHLFMQVSALGHRSDDLVAFAESQIGYILGDTGFSYQIGFGDQGYPLQPHHRSSSCPDQPAECDWDEFNSPAANPQVLYGALVGGPDSQDNYQDSRNDYVKNEVATDYNAGFQSALAAFVMQA